MKRFIHTCESCKIKKDAYNRLFDLLWAAFLHRAINEDLHSNLRDDLIELEPDDCSCWKEYAAEGMKEEY